MDRAINKITMPKLNDLRWKLLVFFLFYITYAITFPGFSRTITQFIVAFSFCVGIDFALLLIRFKKIIFPMSGLISSMGTFLLCDSPFLFPYAVLASLAILSKHFICYKGRHIFNPNNFGLVASLIALGPYMTVSPGRWGGNQIVLSMILVLGTYLVIKAERYYLVAAYLATFLVGVLIRASIKKLPILTVFGPVTGPSFHLFIFYMITDPITTPSRLSRQIIFGVLLGILDTLLRHLSIRYAPFYSLLLLCSTRPLWDGMEFSNQKLIWNTGVFSFSGVFFNKKK